MVFHVARKRNAIRGLHVYHGNTTVFNEINFYTITIQFQIKERTESMITVKDKTGSIVKVDHVVRGTWQNWYLIGLGSGFSCTMILVNANSKQDALDAYADSSFARFTRIDEKDKDDYLQEGRESFAEAMEEIHCMARLASARVTNDSEYLPEINGRPDIKSIVKQIQIALKSLYKEWDFNGPYDCDQVEYLGNHSDMHKLDLRILERIPRKNINWFAKKED